MNDKLFQGTEEGVVDMLLRFLNGGTEAVSDGIGNVLNPAGAGRRAMEGNEPYVSPRRKFALYKNMLRESEGMTPEASDAMFEQASQNTPDEAMSLAMLELIEMLRSER